ncbi:MAG: hypothetical protein M5U25_17220 [Planctomycetota bacterium]|nr:hypothetical protein [Planctomycetota bacterium]
MHKEFAPYIKWFGEWAGHGVSKTNIQVFTRLAIRPRLADQVIEFQVESMDAQSSKLVHGVVALMGLGPDGQLRLAVLSTLHGAMDMPVTPEDPGALAIEGVSVEGNRVVVSLVEENDDLMLTSYWKKEVPGAEPVGFSNVKLQRVAG